MMGDPIYREVADICTRCRQPFSRGALRFMAREHVVYRAIGNYAIHDDRLVAVCVNCLKPKESGPWQAHTCQGCGAPLRRIGPPRQRTGAVVACSSRCRLRAQKARRRLTRPFMYCVICRRAFQPTRADARTCSAGCRQRAYRQRQAGGGPQLEATA
jgi:hypothetical protein